MKPKKSKKDQSASSSESDSSSGSDSTSESSPDPKNPTKKTRKDGGGDSPQPPEEKSKDKLKSRDKEASTSTKSRRDAEHSKWDSPSEKRRSRDNVRRSSVERREDKEKEKGRGNEQGDYRQERDKNNRDRREEDRRGNQRSHEDEPRNRSNEKYKEKRDDHRGRAGDRYDDRRRYDHGKREEYNRFDDRNDRRDRGGAYRRNDDRERSPRRDNSRQRNRRSRSRSFDHRNATWGRADDNSKTDRKPQQDKQKPNFGLSGKLAEETNTFKGVIIKYSEPLEARKPKRRWRLYPFKGEKAMQVLYIHRESAYLIGRDRKVVDLPIDHPSCSKQHAALQYRLVPFTRENGSAGKRVRPYIIDLESANGTFLNQQKIEPKKYVELFEKDVLKFGFSSREYVLLHENSKDEAQDDDVNMEAEEAPVKPDVKEETN